MKSAIKSWAAPLPPFSCPRETADGLLSVEDFLALPWEEVRSKKVTLHLYPDEECVDVVGCCRTSSMNFYFNLGKVTDRIRTTRQIDPTRSLGGESIRLSLFWWHYSWIKGVKIHEES